MRTFLMRIVIYLDARHLRITNKYLISQLGHGAVTTKRPAPAVVEDEEAA